jgi:hypothetical protein
MRRDRGLLCVALSAIAGAMGCSQGEDARVRRAQLREQREGVVRETELTKRVATPQDTGRIIYDPVPSLSLDNLTRRQSPIVGLTKPSQPIEPAQRRGSPAP